MARILPVFLPFAACGSRCLFCDQRAVTGTSEPEDILSSASSQVSKWLGYSSAWDEMAFYGGNFGAVPAGIRRSLYGLAEANRIGRVRFSTRPDTVTGALIDEIKTYNVSVVELGVQSLDDRVLEMNGRPYGRDGVFRAIKDVSSAASCGVQLMTGMYGQSALSSLEDARVLAETDIVTARIYPTQVLKGTPLFSIMENGGYTPASFSDTLLTAAGMYTLFKSKDVDVIRMGLPEDAASGGFVAAGPRHKAFGDVVKTLVALLYFQCGGRCRFFGYKGAVRRVFKDVFPLDGPDAGGVGFNDICRRVRRYFLEDSQRFLESKAVGFAERLGREANDR